MPGLRGEGEDGGCAPEGKGSEDKGCLGPQLGSYKLPISASILSQLQASPGEKGLVPLPAELKDFPAPEPTNRGCHPEPCPGLALAAFLGLTALTAIGLVHAAPPP